MAIIDNLGGGMGASEKEQLQAIYNKVANSEINISAGESLGEQHAELLWSKSWDLEKGYYLIFVSYISNQNWYNDLTITGATMVQPIPYSHNSRMKFTCCLVYMESAGTVTATQSNTGGTPSSCSMGYNCFPLSITTNIPIQ